jgi:hypothetical protein
MIEIHRGCISSCYVFTCVDSAGDISIAVQYRLKIFVGQHEPGLNDRKPGKLVAKMFPEMEERGKLNWRQDPGGTNEYVLKTFQWNLPGLMVYLQIF